MESHFAPHVRGAVLQSLDPLRTLPLVLPCRRAALQGGKKNRYLRRYRRKSSLAAGAHARPPAPPVRLGPRSKLVPYADSDAATILAPHRAVPGPRPGNSSAPACRPPSSPTVPASAAGAVPQAAGRIVEKAVPDVRFARSLHFSTRKLPMTSASIPELKNVRIASVGVCTIASPRRLNEVFMITGTPVRFSNSSSKRQYSGLISFSTVCGRALPSTCVTAGMTPRFSGRTCAVKIMNGESVALSRYSAAASFFSDGANGRHHSRNLTALFTFAFISGSRGSARIERLPSARGPNSIRPWNQPRILPCDRSSAAVAAASSSRVYG